MQDTCKIHRIRILITNPPKFDNKPPVTLPHSPGLPSPQPNRPQSLTRPARRQISDTEATVWKVATSRRRRNVSERASDIGTVHTQVDLALRFVDSCVYARRSGVRIRRNLCIHTHRSRKRTDPRIHTSHPGAFTYTCTPAAYTHPPLAYTHRPAYTHPGAYMHPLRIRTPACVYTPTCVYAPRVRLYAPTRVL